MHHLQLAECNDHSSQRWLKGEGGVLHLQDTPGSCLTIKGSTIPGSTLQVRLHIFTFPQRAVSA
jgi:hypothetical protein